MADERDTFTATRTASQHHARQKRARTQLSCTPCRTGKLKCDRASPCEPCVKRGRESQCNYPPAPTKSKPANVKGRIRQLESLVLDLMNHQKQAPSASDTTISPADHAGSTSSESGRQGPFMRWGSARVISKCVLDISSFIDSRRFSILVTVRSRAHNLVLGSAVRREMDLLRSSISFCLAIILARW